MNDLRTMDAHELAELKSNIDSELFRRDLKEIRALEKQANALRAKAGLRARRPLKREVPLK